MASNTKISKPKGLKDHKKAQKEKAIAKRAAAAAEQAKAKKGSRIDQKAKAVMIQEPIAEDFVEQAVISSSGEIVQKETEVFMIQEVIAEVAVQQNFTFPVEEIAHEEKIEAAVVQIPIVEDTVISPVDEVSQKEPIVDVAVIDQNISVVARKIDEDVSEQIAIPTITIEAPTTINAISQDIEVAAPILVDDEALAAEAAATRALRKKLEADMYENMESPQERFVRLNNIASATVEDLYGVLDFIKDGVFSDCSLAGIAEPERAADDTGLEYGAVANDAAYASCDIPEDAIVAETTNLSIDEVAAVYSNEALTISKAITMAQLFSSTANTGISTVGISSTKKSLTLDEVEKQQKSKGTVASETSKSSSLNVSQLFAAVKAEGATIVCLPKAVAAATVPAIDQLFAAEDAECRVIVRLPIAAGDFSVRTARTHRSVLAGMTFVCKDEIVDDTSPVEPVIVDGVSREGVGRKLRETIVFTCPDELDQKHTLVDPSIVSSKVRKQQDVPESSSVLDGQEGGDKIMALLGFPRSRTTSDSSLPTPPQFSPLFNGRTSTPNTCVTVTPPLLDDVLAKTNGHNFSGHGYDSGGFPNMGDSSLPYQNHGFGPQYPATQYVAQPFFPGQYYLSGLPGYTTPFYGHWQYSQGHAPY